jgi:hypothetical protein
MSISAVLVLFSRSHGFGNEGGRIMDRRILQFRICVAEDIDTRFFFPLPQLVSA